MNEALANPVRAYGFQYGLAPCRLASLIPPASLSCSAGFSLRLVQGWTDEGCRPSLRINSSASFGGAALGAGGFSAAPLECRCRDRICMMRMVVGLPLGPYPKRSLFSNANAPVGWGDRDEHAGSLCRRWSPHAWTADGPHRH